MTAARPKLFTPILLRQVEARNRVVISPMCQYSAIDGIAGDFHLTHLGKFALGGAGMVFAEATAVCAEGRISYHDLCLYEDRHIAPLQRITRFLVEHGAVPAIQLNHAGRKAGSRAPWHGGAALEASDAEKGHPPWPLVAPSALAAEGFACPRAMSERDIADNIATWVAATVRAVEAGFLAIEIHGGHGYLVHQFLSPISNVRTDGYGGDLHGRIRFALELAQAVRAAMPTRLPLFFRTSALDGSAGGWTMEDTVVLARELGQRGVDVIDCSSGGMTAPTPTRVIPRTLGFQVPYAARLRRDTSLMTMAVGLIVEADQAEQILQDGDADLIAIGREALDDPNWPSRAALELEGNFNLWPQPYRDWLAKRSATLVELRKGLGGKTD